MAKKDDTDPSALKMRVAVIEGKEKMQEKWKIYGVYHETHPLFDQVGVTLACCALAQKWMGHEFRYRYATLTFDDDGSKCVIY